MVKPLSRQFSDSKESITWYEMSKYAYNAIPDPYCYPNSDVMINRFGIKNAMELDAVERELTLNRLGELLHKPVSGRFGFTHLKRIHKAVFGDLFEWAGQPREHGFITKGETIFCNAGFIDQEAVRIFGQLASDDNKLRGLEFDKFVERLVYYSSEINALHPFRDGNGRSLREFIRQLAAANGYSIRWQLVPPDVLLRADISAFYKEYDSLKSVYNRILMK